MYVFALISIRQKNKKKTHFFLFQDGCHGNQRWPPCVFHKISIVFFEKTTRDRDFKLAVNILYRLIYNNTKAFFYILSSLEIIQENIIFNFFWKKSLNIF